MKQPVGEIDNGCGLHGGQSSGSSRSGPWHRQDFISITNFEATRVLGGHCWQRARRQIILPKTSASGNWYRDAVHPCSQNSGCTVPTPFGGIQTPTNENCPFCRKRDTAIRYQNAAGFAFLDSFPISNGYMLGRSRSGHLRRREAVAGDPSPEASAMPTRLPSDLVAGWKPES
jgi:hypothetical protein